MGDFISSVEYYISYAVTSLITFNGVLSRRECQTQRSFNIKGHEVENNQARETLAVSEIPVLFPAVMWLDETLFVRVKKIISRFWLNEVHCERTFQFLHSRKPFENISIYIISANSTWRLVIHLYCEVFPCFVIEKKKRQIILSCQFGVFKIKTHRNENMRYQ